VVDGLSSIGCDGELEVCGWSCVAGMTTSQERVGRCHEWWLDSISTCFIHPPTHPSFHSINHNYFLLHGKRNDMQGKAELSYTVATIIYVHPAQRGDATFQTAGVCTTTRQWHMPTWQKLRLLSRSSLPGSDGHCMMCRTSCNGCQQADGRGRDWFSCCHCKTKLAGQCDEFLQV